MGLKSAVHAISTFMIVEFVLIAFILLLVNPFGDPLPFFVNVCSYSGTTVWELATAILIVGTLADIVLMAVISIRR